MFTAFAPEPTAPCSAPPEPRRVALATLGCKLNTYETQGVAEVLRRRGYAEVAFGEVADLYVINTCTVTGKADHESRQLVRRALRANPEAQIVVVGCAAQRDPRQFTAIAGVDLVLGNREKQRFADFLPSLAGGGKLGPPRVSVSPLDADSPFEDLAISDFPGYTRAFLKIQDGCDFACTFCVIPSVRGRSCSMPPDTVVERVRGLAARGFPEVVLTGVLMGSYGRDLAPRMDLAGLVERILAATPIRKVRLSSLLPIEIKPRLADLVVGEDRLCKHLHLPLQSGDDGVLRAMRRPYKRARYAELVHALRERSPALGIGADLIVGFPGEDDATFDRTCAFVEELPLTYLHVFSYSNRAGTRAASLPAPVPGDVVRRRNHVLQRIGAAKAAAFRAQLLGTEQDAIVLSERDSRTGLQRALTHNYIQVLLSSPAAPGLARVALQGLRGPLVFGTVRAAL